MMPKGVEHFHGQANQPYRGRVKIPMMPKGVEHSKFVAITVERNPLTVKIPMMPKGVEHRIRWSSKALARS